MRYLYLYFLLLIAKLDFRSEVPLYKRDFGIYGEKTYSFVMYASEVVEVFLGDHESGEISSVAGNENDGEESEHACHKATGQPTRVVRVY